MKKSKFILLLTSVLLAQGSYAQSQDEQILDPKSRSLISDASQYLEGREVKSVPTRFSEEALNIRYDDVFICRDDNYLDPVAYTKCILARSYDLREKYQEETKICYALKVVDPDVSYYFGASVRESNTSTARVPFDDSRGVCAFQVSSQIGNHLEQSALRKCTLLIGLSEGEVYLKRMKEFISCVEKELE